VWKRYLIRGAAFVAIQWGSKALLFYVGVGCIGCDFIAPFDHRDNAIAYYEAINRVAYVGSVIIACLCVSWWQSVDPLWKLPWVITRRQS
jgi:hypothetical protein